MYVVSLVHFAKFTQTCFYFVAVHSDQAEIARLLFSDTCHEVPFVLWDFNECFCNPNLKIVPPKTQWEPAKVSCSTFTCHHKNVCLKSHLCSLFSGVFQLNELMLCKNCFYLSNARPDNWFCYPCVSMSRNCGIPVDWRGKHWCLVWSKTCWFDTFEWFQKENLLLHEFIRYWAHLRYRVWCSSQLCSVGV